jgi:hypothetical protein
MTSAGLQAERAVNRELVQLYWDIGHGIGETQRTLGRGGDAVDLNRKEHKEHKNFQNFESLSSLCSLRLHFWEVLHDQLWAFKPDER